MRAEIILDNSDIRKAIREYVYRYYATSVPVDSIDLQIEHVFADCEDVSALYSGKVVFSMDSVPSLTINKREV